MRFIPSTTNTMPLAGSEQRYQDYLRISQSAKAIALAARRQAVRSFWTHAVHTLRNMGHHASVRLGAGHNITRMEAS